MMTAMRLLGYGAALVLAFGLAWGVGTVIGPPGLPTAGTAPSTTASGSPATASGSHGSHEPAAAPTDPSSTGPLSTGPSSTGPASTGPAPSPATTEHQHPATGGIDTQGLSATAAGYTVTPEVSTFAAGRTGELQFTVTGSDGRPVTAFDTLNGQQLHLVVIRRDTTGFQHLHPALGPDGVWRTPLELPAAGAYRMFADFVPTGGPQLVLGADLLAAGEFSPTSFAASRVAQVGGYQVRLDGDLVPGSPSQIFATVTRDGVAVTDLQPYLGAFGHLVALRRTDLAYTHIHSDAAAAPVAADRSGPGIAFTAQVPTAGSYRLFLDFRHEDVVRTAEFTVDTRDGA